VRERHSRHASACGGLASENFGADHSANSTPAFGAFAGLAFTAVIGHTLSAAWQRALRDLLRRTEGRISGACSTALFALLKRGLLRRDRRGAIVRGAIRRFSFSTMRSFKVALRACFRAFGRPTMQRLAGLLGTLLRLRSGAIIAPAFGAAKQRVFPRLARRTLRTSSGACFGRVQHLFRGLLRRTSARIIRPTQHLLSVRSRACFWGLLGGHFFRWCNAHFRGLLR